MTISLAVLGGGVGGLALAHGLLRDRPGQYDVTILEARDRIGGRCLSLRPGDSIQELGREKQTCTFEQPEGDPVPYLNAGPGRIPSGHKRLLARLHELKVELEVYVMESRANLIRSEGEKATVAEFGADYCGWLAAALWDPRQPATAPWNAALRAFGQLDMMGRYTNADRRGYAQLPGVHDGIVAEPMAMQRLLASRFWERSFFQPRDFLWQVTSFQPVGGMDRVAHAFAEAAVTLGATIHLNAPVVAVRRHEGRYRIIWGDGTTGEFDQVVSNMPLPLLFERVDQSTFDAGSQRWFRCLSEVAASREFLRPTCKVGWQAERSLWQENHTPGGVPIYGGISRIDHPMTQMWYPSNDYNAQLGVLTGTYNYDDVAASFGRESDTRRLEIAREGASLLHSPEFAQGLKQGISIAWQNMPHIRGGWCDWNEVEGTHDHGLDCYNTLLHPANGNTFHVVGDQMSELPGWQEGAVRSAEWVQRWVERAAGGLESISHQHRRHAVRLPDTRRLTQGHF